MRPGNAAPERTHRAAGPGERTGVPHPLEAAGLREAAAGRCPRALGQASGLTLGSSPRPRQRRRCLSLSISTLKSISLSLPLVGAGPAPASPGQVRPEAQRVPPAAISPRSGRLRRGVRPPLLPSPRCGPRRWAWLGLRLQRGARRESRSPRRGEPSAQAHGGGGGGGRRAAGAAAAPAPRPPTRTCCRAAVSWRAASSTAAADDLLARPQPLRTPGVPARAGDDRLASRSPVQRSPPYRNLGRRRSRRPRGATK